VSLLAKIKALVQDPPPEYVFELSEAGIAWARTADPGNVHWTPLPEGTITVSPLENNVKQPEALAAAVRLIVSGEPPRKQRRPAALILPDYCARVAVLDFDTFPSEPEEQAPLAKFRMKRAVPFDIEGAVVSCYAQPRNKAGKIDVVVAAVNIDVASHFEAPFRAVGFHCGFITLSAISALSLQAENPEEGVSPSVVAKLSGSVLALALLDGPAVRMFRCVQLRETNEREAMDVLATTFAYAEDELGGQPKVLRLCGIPRQNQELRDRWSREFGLPVTGMLSRFGAPGAFNSGLYGYLESVEGS
jgi:type IV pilus assembly protein PilM